MLFPRCPSSLGGLVHLPTLTSSHVLRHARANHLGHRARLSCTGEQISICYPCAEIDIRYLCATLRCLMLAPQSEEIRYFSTEFPNPPPRGLRPTDRNWPDTYIDALASCVTAVSVVCAIQHACAEQLMFGAASYRISSYCVMTPRVYLISNMSCVWKPSRHSMDCAGDPFSALVEAVKLWSRLGVVHDPQVTDLEAWVHCGHPRTRPSDPPFHLTSTGPTCRRYGVLLSRFFYQNTRGSGA